MGKQLAWDRIDDTASEMIEASNLIWEYAETAFLETGSMKILCDLLRKEGFEVEEGTAGIATAFKGTFGSGKPVIGFLGEYDALSGLSQVAGISEKMSLMPGAPGHGCGHNMLGVGSLSAAIGVKKYLEETGKSGTVVYFGCPGEEGGSGKAFMAKSGAFEGLDAAITWHPGDMNRADTRASLANYQVAYKFYGTSAHAGSSAHHGRSALDALELMNMGVQFLREHVIPEARIHYAITNTGGYSPNVVQPYAEVLYLIRAPKNSQLEEIYQRVNKIAEGAALMTETKVEIDFVKGCSSLISNRVIARKLWENLHEVGAPEYTEEEMMFAKAIHESVAEPYANLEKFAAMYDKKADKREIMSHKGEFIHRFVLPFHENGSQGFGSTDVGDVSWNCPTAQIYVATWAVGTPGHSWQIVAQGKSKLAHKGMLYAAKAMAGTAIDMIDDPSLVEAAKAELMDTLDGEHYICPIPDGCKPRAIGVKKA
ncbi:MAG: amidohydrolase [Lachnospiraceae bacterium]|nr:amidohydrolase [Lachnospiraceae bacterium]